MNDKANKEEEEDYDLNALINDMEVEETHYPSAKSTKGTIHMSQQNGQHNSR